MYAAVKATFEMLGLKSLINDLGGDAGTKLFVDAKATIGMLSRKGLGSAKHIEASYLWIQDKIRTKTVELGKIDTRSNPADMMTKHLDWIKTEKHTARLGGIFVKKDTVDREKKKERAV